jgi:cellulose biosynthesis protein BcsQ
MKTISLYSIKGGVGKTTTCVNLAYLASLKYRTLLIDLDPQSAASFYLRIQSSKSYNDQKLLKGHKKISPHIKATDFENLDLLPSDISYRNLDIKLDEFKKSDRKLRRLLEDFSSEYDCIFLDCPPNLTLLSENIFNASDQILVPIIPTTLSIRTFHQVSSFFKENQIKKKKLKPYFSMVEIRKKLHRDSIISFTKSFPKTLNVQIPASAEIEKMGIHQCPVFNYISKSSLIAQRYRDLLEKIETKSHKSF